MSPTEIDFRFVSFIAIVTIASFIIGCKEDSSQIGNSESLSASSEASVDSYFEDVEDISSTASLATDSDLGGRATKLDDRFCDNVKVYFLRASSTNPDTIVVDFGADPGCTDPRGNVRKGKVIIVLIPGSRFQIGNQVSTTFENYSVNGIKIEGVRTVTLTSLTPPTHKIELANGKVTWPDNTFATRDAHHFRKWDNKGTLTRNDDEIRIYGTTDYPGGASGTNRNEKGYTMQILEDIVFKVQCALENKFLPVSGVKVIDLDGKEIIINYGTGDCNNSVILTVNGESKEVTVKRD